MLKPLSWLAIGTASALLPPASHGMGFGELRGSALINRPLSFAARVNLGPDEVLEPGCVRAEVLSGDEKLAADQIKVSFPQGLASGDRTVFVTTTRRMDEPVVTVTVTLGCTSRVSRKFVLFLDPPTVNLASSADVPSSAAASRSDASNSSAETSASQTPAPPFKRPRAEGVRPSGSPSGIAASDTPARSETVAPAFQKSPRPRARPVARSNTKGPRLHVDALPSEPSRTPLPASPKTETPSQLASNAAQPATPLPAANGPTVVPGTRSELDLLRAELEKERQRSRVLESALAQLQKQQSGTQQAIAELQSRAAPATTQRDANPIVYLLGAFCAILVLLLIVMLWRAPRGSSRRWWDGSRQASMTDIGPETGPRIDSRLPSAEPAWLREVPAAGSSVRAVKPSAPDSVIGGLEVTAVPDHGLLFSMPEENVQATGAVKAPAMSSPGRIPEQVNESASASLRKPITLDLDLSSGASQP